MSQVFAFQNHPVRTITENDQIWFAAVDVCRVLGISWRGNTLAAIPDAWQGMRKLRTPQTDQMLRVISEPAVYKLAFRSNKPEADSFTNWVASEVLPSIRKTGKFESAPRKFFLPEPSPKEKWLQIFSAYREAESVFRPAWHALWRGTVEFGHKSSGRDREILHALGQLMHAQGAVVYATGVLAGAANEVVR